MFQRTQLQAGHLVFLSLLSCHNEKPVSDHQGVLCTQLRHLLKDTVSFHNYGQLFYLNLFVVHNQTRRSACIMEFSFRSTTLSEGGSERTGQEGRVEEFPADS